MSTGSALRTSPQNRADAPYAVGSLVRCAAAPAIQAQTQFEERIKCILGLEKCEHKNLLRRLNEDLEFLKPQEDYLFFLILSDKMREANVRYNYVITHGGDRIDWKGEFETYALHKWFTKIKEAAVISSGDGVKVINGTAIENLRTLREFTGTTMPADMHEAILDKIAEACQPGALLQRMLRPYVNAAGLPVTQEYANKFYEKILSWTEGYLENALRLYETISVRPAGENLRRLTDILAKSQTSQKEKYLPIFFDTEAPKLSASLPTA
jgi:hypothetical protein